MGIGHLRRHLLVAGALAATPLGASVLMIAGVSEASAFALPPRVDLLTLPSLKKESGGGYESRRLGLPPGDSSLPPAGGGRRARRTPRPPRASRGVLVVLAIISVLLVGALVVDLVAGPVQQPAAEPVAQEQATSGTWYCPSVASDGGYGVP